MNLKLVKPEQETHELHFSYSQLNTYLLCPMKYAHNYVWGTPPERKPINLITGKAIHRAAEHYYRSIKDTGAAPDEDEVVDVFTSVFAEEASSSEVEISLKKDQTPASVREQGIALVRLFYAETRPQNIVAVEQPFSIGIPDLDGGILPIRMAGYFDLIESDDEGNQIVCELKTSAQRFSSMRLAHDLQPTIYTFAMKQLRPQASVTSCLVRYDVLVKTRKAAFEQYFVTRTDGDHRRLVHLLNHVLKAVEQRIFYRIQGWMCEECQFKKACLG